MDKQDIRPRFITHGTAPELSVPAASAGVAACAAYLKTRTLC